MRVPVRGFCIAGAAAMVFGCSEPPPAETVLRPVRTVTVSSSAEAQVRTFAGLAKAGTESRLSFRVAGTVERIPVVVGQKVERGAVLAALDTTDYELRVQEAVAGLAQAEAASRNAEADYDRVRALYENNNASRRELDAARAGSESSSAQVDAAAKRLEQARQQLSYTRLRSPEAGTVASSNIEVNEAVQAGQMAFLLTSGGSAEVEVSLPEQLIASIELGQQVSVSFPALPGRSFDATVSEAGAAAVGTATTFPVVVRLASADPDIRSGMAAEVGFRFAPSAGADRLVIPAVAVGEDREGTYVFVLVEDGEGAGIVRRRAVAVGGLSDRGIEVLDGVHIGDRVVTAGVRRLSDGERVAAETAP